MSEFEANIPTRKRADYQRHVREWDRIARKDGLTRTANNWLLQSLDGFHDTPMKPVDIPDGVQGKLVVHEITREITVSKPSGLAAGGTWDFHICTNNLAGATDFGTNGVAGFPAVFNAAGVTKGMSANLVSGVVQGQGSDMPVIGAPIIMNRCTSGQPTFSSIASTVCEYGAIDIGSRYLKGPCRVVGMAYEVVNTTPTLYKNGSVTSYRVPMRSTSQIYEENHTEGAGATVRLANGTTVASIAAINPRGPIEYIAAAAPPSNVATASLATDSALWDAKEGAYVNAVFERKPEMKYPRPLVMMWTGVDATESDLDTGCDTKTVRTAFPSVNWLSDATMERNLINTFATSGGNTDGSAGAAVNAFCSGPPRLVEIPVARSGSYFTGLNENTTFTVRSRFFVARVPSINDGDIYTLASLPPPADPEVWKLYSEVSEHVPAAAMFTENPFGEWFSKVLGTVRDWAPKVGNLVGNVVPGAAMLGNSIGSVAGAAKTALKALGGDTKAKGKLEKEIERRVEAKIEKAKKSGATSKK